MVNIYIASLKASYKVKWSVICKGNKIKIKILMGNYIFASQDGCNYSFIINKKCFIWQTYVVGGK